jgi:hypothetical protein
LLFIAYKKANQETGCKTKGQSENIDKGEAFVVAKIPESGFQEIWNHDIHLVIDEDIKHAACCQYLPIGFPEKGNSMPNRYTIDKQSFKRTSLFDVFGGEQFLYAFGTLICHYYF